MFIVIEIQMTDKVATLVTAHEDRNEAEAKYHAILAAAAKSKVAVHSCVMLTESGYFIKSEKYEHKEV